MQTDAKTWRRSKGAAAQLAMVAWEQVGRSAARKDNQRFAATMTEIQPSTVGRLLRS